ETFTGNPNYIQTDVERYESVTAEDVLRVYEEYIKGKPAVVMSIVPKGQGDTIAQPDTWDRYERTIPERPTAEGLELREPVDTFDRSVQPPASNEDLSIALPDLYRTELSNGIEVLGALNTETPTTALQIRIKAGQRSEPLDKLGLAELTAGMIGEATERSTNEDLANRLAKLGSEITISAGDEYTTITVRSLTDKLDETLDIAMERLFEPGFKPEDFERLKAQTLQGIEFSKTQPAVTATAVFNQILFGRDNAFAYQSQGLTPTVESITLDDVKAFYEANYSASIASVLAVSDLSETEMTAKLARLSDWAADTTAPTTLNAFPELPTGKLFLVDKPDAAQSEIRIGRRALPYDATGDFYRSGIMNFVLGGAFNSRINLNLREDKGYSYGAFSFFDGEEDYGFFRAQAGVRTNTTADSITQFLNEMNGYYEGGITDAELEFTKSAIGQRDARDYETPFQKLRFISNILTYDLPNGFVDEQKDILAGITIDEVNDLARANLDTDEMVIVVVGDKEEILPSISELGFDIVELDADGNPVEE
ncbi:MAG: pitrilysin family protein, partial [Pseudomonadota bacterium]